jgi:hypothetical protein
MLTPRRFKMNVGNNKMTPKQKQAEEALRYFNDYVSSDRYQTHHKFINDLLSSYAKGEIRELQLGEVFCTKLIGGEKVITRDGESLGIVIEKINEVIRAINQLRGV